MTRACADRQGLVHVYMGNGKGKTTAAIGLAVRAAGHGMRTFVAQFMKGRASGERTAMQGLNRFITVEQYGRRTARHPGDDAPSQRDVAQAGLARACAALLGGEYDIVVLDEVSVAVDCGILTEDEVLDLIDHRPPGTELVLTGRGASQAIVERADLVTEMREVRHPFRRGISARRGIEY